MNSRIIRHRLPWWYSLGWEACPPAIVLRLSHPFAEFIGKTIRADSPILKEFEIELSLQPWESSMREGAPWGFNEAFRCGLNRTTFILLEARVPRIRIPTGKPCATCKGKRTDSFDRTQKCFDCGGTGKGYIIDWKAAESLSATFAVFTRLAELFEYKTYEKDVEHNLVGVPQLITLQTIIHREMHGGSLGGSYSTDLVSWLSRARLTTIPEATDAMQTAWARMWERVQDGEKFDFRAGCYHHPQQLLIDCPGNACGLHQGTDFDFKGNANGYDFECHNVDSSAQQLTLIAALAAIEDRVRHELKLEI